MLTRKQHQLLTFIDDYLHRTGFSPSFDEMKVAIGLHSKSGIHRLVTALEERGFIRRHHQRARALEVLKSPPRPAGKIVPLTPHGLQSRENVSPPVPTASAKPPLTGSVEIPVYGRIAAGVPIEAVKDTGETAMVPASMLGRGQYYALIVAGDSMEGAGIMDADTVIIQETPSAENGQIVVALIDGEEVTLKRLRKRGPSIALEAANPRYETRILPAERVTIQGVLTSLLRKY
ncbi:transcriptional repressor LexA [Sorlinia euscelidii]